MALDALYRLVLLGRIRQFFGGWRYRPLGADGKALQKYRRLHNQGTPWILEGETGHKRDKA